jgi:hypothetical protein
MDSCADKTTKDAATAPMEAFAKAGQALVSSFAELAKLGLALTPALQPATRKSPGCCDIPPPCWMPKPLGELRSFACPGASATVRVRITNSQPRQSSVQVAFAGTGDLQTSVEPQSLTLAPMERGWVTASVTLPADACKGRRHDLLLWVYGCASHYLRWSVEACEGGSGSCHEVEVGDGIDPIHHWYDHFYCGRSCMGTPRDVPTAPPIRKGR